jgi:hypothetical protein
MSVKVICGYNDAEFINMTRFSLEEAFDIANRYCEKMKYE